MSTFISDKMDKQVQQKKKTKQTKQNSEEQIYIYICKEMSKVSRDEGLCVTSTQRNKTLF